MRKLRFQQIVLCAFALILAAALIAAPAGRPPNIIGPWQPGDPVPPDMTTEMARATMGLPPVTPLRTQPPIFGEKPVRTVSRDLVSRATQPDVDLTPNTSLSNEVDPDWSKRSNDDFVVFASNGQPSAAGQISGTLPARANYHIWMMAGDGTLQAELTKPAAGTDDREPAWSPRSQFISFSRKSGTGSWEIYTFDPSTPAVAPQLLTVSNMAGTGDKKHPTWDPSGTKIAYQYRPTPADDWDIYWIPVDLSGPAQAVVATASNEVEPNWSLAGDLIAYASDQGGAFKIWTAQSNGASATQRSDGGVTAGTGTAANIDREPNFNSSGTRISFASDRDTGDGSAGDFNVWSMADSGEIGVSAVDAVLHSNRFTDTASDTYPTYSRSIGSTYPVPAIGFVSDRGAATTDIWQTQSDDVEPPELQELPKVDARLVAPGSNLVIHVRVTDRESDVAQVRAIFRDPDGFGDDVRDHKIYQSSGNLIPNEGLTDEEDHRFSAMREWSWERVGEITLSPDPAYGPASQQGEWYTGTWTTPGRASDFYIDVLVADNWGNDLTYDTIYGFSTKIFTPQGRILYVDDYGHGQKFLYNSGFYSEQPAQWGTESYFLDNPGATDRGQGAVYPDVDANSIGGTASYDIWRVICRDKITLTDLTFYLPKTKQQLLPKTVEDSDAIVIWNAPQTGHVWTTPNEGSIIASDVQNTLQRYLDRGGRLMISGQNIAWMLTANGLYQNSFITDYLKAQFVRGTWFTGPENNDDTINCAGNTAGLIAGDPFRPPGYVWGGAHYYHITTAVEENPSFARTPINHDPAETAPRFHDASWATVWEDIMKPLGGGQAVYTYPDGANAAAIIYRDTAKGYWSLYFPMGFEQIHREYHSHNEQFDCLNFRSHIVHNFYCASNTGTFAGIVGQTQTGGKPIAAPYPIVEVMANRSPGNVAGWAATCDSQGRWITYGIEPGWHEYHAVRHGFVELEQPSKITMVHGGGRSTGNNILLTKTEPGSISGKVTFKGTGNPAGGVPVYATPALAPEVEASMTPEQLLEYQAAFDGWATTGPDGKYIIANLEVGDYHVAANVEKTVDGTALPGFNADYGSEPTTQKATVTPSSDTPNVDFALVAAPGSIVAYVYDKQKRDGGIAEEQVPNATVTIKSGTQAAGSGSTKADGKTDPISVSPSDQYVAVARAAGYKVSAETAVGAVISKETTNVEIGLDPEPPGSVLGFVALKTAPTTAVEGVTISVVDPVTGAALKSPTGDPLVATTSATKSYDSVTQSSYNFRIENCPTGEVKILASRGSSGPDQIVFRSEPEFRIVTVKTGLPTGGANFLMTGLHTFPAGVSLVSAPYDYSDRTIGQLLGLSTVQAAVWNPQTREYTLYPTAPADRFRLGRGYWVKFGSPIELSIQGALAQDPYRIPLSTGWNMIGNPFPEAVDFYSAAVDVESNGQVMSMQQALSTGVLANGLWSYLFGGYRLSSQLVPWSGYWVKALKPATLIVHDPSTAPRGVTIPEIADNPRGAFRAPTEGWLMPLTAQAGAMEDVSAFIGAASDATDGADSRYDVPRPPAARLAGFVQIGFPHTDWGSSADLYAVDVRGPVTGEKSWEFVVETNLADTDVTLTWPDMREMPNGLVGVLEDLDGGTKRYMRTTTGYTFHTGTGGDLARRFRVTVSAGAAGSLGVSEFVTTPGRGGTTELAYRLSRTASVTVTIRNIAGRVIRTLTTSEVQGAGLNRIAWDGRNNDGAGIPSGTYLCEIHAQTEDGQQVRAVRPVTVVR